MPRSCSRPVPDQSVRLLGTLFSRFRALDCLVSSRPVSYSDLSHVYPDYHIGRVQTYGELLFCARSSESGLASLVLSRTTPAWLVTASKLGPGITNHTLAHLRPRHRRSQSPIPTRTTRPPSSNHGSSSRLSLATRTANLSPQPRSRTHLLGISPSLSSPPFSPLIFSSPLDLHRPPLPTPHSPRLPTHLLRRLPQRMVPAPSRAPRLPLLPPSPARHPTTLHVPVLPRRRARHAPRRESV